MYETYIFCPKSKKPNVQNFQLFLPEGKTPAFIRKIFVGLREIIGFVRYILI